jgi:hypothetical protein
VELPPEQGFAATLVPQCPAIGHQEPKASVGPLSSSGKRAAESAGWRSTRTHWEDTKAMQQSSKEARKQVNTLGERI